MANDHAALLEFSKILDTQSSEEFRSCFLVQTHNSSTDNLQVAEREFRTDFTAPAGGTKADLSRFLGGQSDLLHGFNQVHIGSRVEFGGLNLFPNLGNVFHSGSFVVLTRKI